MPPLNALVAAVPLLQANPAHRLLERDFQRAVEAVTDARPKRVLMSRWPGVGPLDLALAGRVGIELKWCNGGSALATCAWDAAKLASLLVDDVVDEAYLAAGAPAAHWAAAEPGVDLFAQRTYEGDAIVARYAAFWRHWCADVITRPVALPTSFSVTPAGSAGFELHGVPWELRLARVDVVDATWRRHVCPHHADGGSCPRDEAGRTAGPLSAELPG